MRLSVRSQCEVADVTNWHSSARVLIEHDEFRPGLLIRADRPVAAPADLP